MQRALSGVLLVVLQSGVVGCGSEDEPEPGGECFDYAGWDGTTQKVSFRSRLLNDGVGATGGLLRRACAASTCHGAQARPDGELYLGPPLAVNQALIPITEAQRVLVHQHLLAESKTNLEVARVVPFEPENSFLMHKLDGCFTGVSAGCKALTGAKSGNACGDRMPQDNPPLPDTERDEIRRWIAQGAVDD